MKYKKQIVVTLSEKEARVLNKVLRFVINKKPVLLTPEQYLVIKKMGS